MALKFTEQELLATLTRAGLVYSPTSEIFTNGGEISWPAMFELAKKAAEPADFWTPEIPCSIGAEAFIMVFFDDIWDAADLAGADSVENVVQRAAEFIAGKYWGYMTPLDNVWKFSQD